jgi:hypothetical protein
VDTGVVTAFPPAAVESEMTDHFPALTGAFEAYKTMFVLAACAERAGMTMQAAKITANKKLGKNFWRIAILISS